VSAHGLRTINKKGVVAAIQEAREKGIIEKI
jgi:ribosomal protein L28